MANEAGTAVTFVEDVLRLCGSESIEAVTFFAILDRVSRDDTEALLRGLAENDDRLCVIWAPENRNVVDAYVTGYRSALNAGCDWILEIDAGYSHQPDDIPKFLELVNQHPDCVFGSRFCAGGVMEGPLKRRILSRGGTVLANALLGTRLTDMTSGFELFSRAALEEVLAKGIRSRGHFFQTEIKAYCRSMTVIEVPIRYTAPSASVSANVLGDAMVNLFRLASERLKGTMTVGPSGH